MFGIGGTELLVILVVALLVLGPKSLPQVAKTLGRALGEFRRVSTEFQRTLNMEVEMEEHEKRKKEAESELFAAKSTADEAPPASPAPPSQASSASPSADTVDETAATGETVMAGETAATGEAAATATGETVKGKDVV